MKNNMMYEPVKIRGSRLRICCRLLWILLTAISCRLFFAEDSDAASIVYPLVMTAAGGMVCFRSVWGRREGRSRNYLRQLLWDMSQDEDYRDVFESGKHWFLVNDRRTYWNAILILLLIQGNGLLVLHQLLHNDVSIKYGYIALYGGTILVSLFLLIRHQREKFMGILTEEIRPLTSAIAFLMEAMEGGDVGYPYAILVHNAAVGLCRSGQYESALGLEDACRRETKNEVLRFCSSNLRYTCLQNLNRTAGADREADILKEILQKKPGLQKTEGISACMYMIKIWEELRDGKREQAWAYTEACLEQCKNDFYRLPVLSIQAMIEEDRGRTEQVETIYKQILSYSPENIEVRRARAYGGKSYYQESGQLFQDIAPDIVRCILSVIGAFVLFILIILCKV